VALRSRARRSLLLVTLSLGAFGMAAACSSSGGPITGPADSHCGSKAQPTSQSACQGGMGGSSSSSSSSSGAGGAEMGGDYGATLENAEGDDDDCKYHVKFTSTDIGENKDVTFTVVVTNKADGKPTTGAKTAAELFLSDTHPGPNTDQKVTESPNGTYQVGPVRFDAPGKWTVRFHFFEDCSDLNEQSPHGHVAFFVNVP
jgi:YtkA-like